MSMKRLNGEGTWGNKTINGIKYVRFRKTYDGKRIEFYGKTKTEVQKKIKEYESKNITDRKVSKESIQLYMARWQANTRVNEIEDGSFASEMRLYKTYVKDSDIGRMQLSQLGTKTYQDYFNELANTYSRNTIEKIYYLYKACFKYAVKVGDMKENPLNGITLPKEKQVVKKKKKIPFLQANDIERLYKEPFRLNTNEFRITGQAGTRVYGINAFAINVIMYTGLRAGEITGLQWKHIDFENKLLHVEQAYHKKHDIDDDTEIYVIGVPKYNSFRTIPLSDRAIESLMQIYNNSENTSHDDFVVTCRQRRLAQTLDRMLLRSGCDVQHCGLHALRHTFGSMLLEKKVDLKTISTLLGHKDIATTANIYLDVSNKLAIDSIALLDKLNN